MIIIVEGGYEKESFRMTKAPRSGTLCPVARAEEVVGDRWTVLVLRELFMGRRRFDEIEAQTGATPQMVASRLKQLEVNGMVERRGYQQRPIRYEYHLTAKGVAFYPVLLALRDWGENWCKAPGEEAAIDLVHLPCGGDAGLGTHCAHCGKPLRHDEVKGTPTPAYVRERASRGKRPTPDAREG
jgi:DNA-binding HxlR family transcriptional regulator